MLWSRRSSWPCSAAKWLPAGSDCGGDRAAAKDVLKSGTVDLSGLDAAVERLSTNLLYMFPGCVSKTIQSLRKHKLAHWDQNKESNRSWLALNMMNEATAGFRAFNEPTKHHREIDFIKLRQDLAAGAKWGPEFIESVLPAAREPVS